MFRIPGILPTGTAGTEEFTDFIEWECVKNGTISINDAVKPILRINDEIKIDGITDESDLLTNKMDDILNEIEFRNKASNNRYPFVIENKGYTITIPEQNQFYWVYVYLLLSTRLNMLTHKIWDGIDGTKILEKLSAEIAKNYFGERAESAVFGTAISGGFENKVNDLIEKIKEGRSFINRNHRNIPVQDDKLDVVVWKHFSDKKISKMIGFGQCKTGTTWDDTQTIELQPQDFCEKWFMDTPVSAPVKMFFCSQYFPLDLYSKAKNAGLIFDRFRILDYLPDELEPSLLPEIIIWCNAAIRGLS